MCLFSLHVCDAWSIEAERSDIQFACRSEGTIHGGLRKVGIGL